MPTPMTRDEIDELLTAALIGRLGMIAEGQPYVVPISFAYRDGAVYCHSAQGRKVQALRTQPEVCFEVDELDHIDRWRSVIAWGSFQQLLGGEAKEATELLVDRFRPLVPATAEGHQGAELGMMRTLDIPRLAEARARVGQSSAAAVVFRVNLHTLTGRKEGEW
ncbi:pyridoxamine 5'-phosphate oxidase family protein [Leifsonia sp. NPDC056824]|uniref:pyridoxamine 5'-phosphate oxidase family protein n=1 Tax=Leifsonia sp. NPDC056824 TaxID=3345953 RepID=UPI00367F674E